MIKFGDTHLTFDIESHSVTERYGMSPREYFRLGGYAWGEGPVVLTDSYDEMIAQIERADMVIGHNIHQFDLSVLFGVDSMHPLKMGRQRKIFDTFIHATLANPAPEGYYELRNGKKARSTSVGEYRKWYGLDNQAFQLGAPGKSADLSEIAKRYEFAEVPILGPDGEPVRFKSGKRKGEAKTQKVPTGVCCGYGHIPLDDPEFREYLEHDVLCSREVARALLSRMSFDHYAQREQLKAAIDAQISRNGFRVDVPVATQRAKDMGEIAAHGLNELNGRFGLPLHGKKPLATTEGKEGLLRALLSVGVREMELERTPGGAPSFSGDSVKKACGWTKDDHDVWVRPSADSPEMDSALDLADLVATLAGQRSLPELALSCVQPDGKVHPSIWPGQRSGRKSTTEPGLTIWDDSHKDYFIADSDDELLIELDASNADARMVAAESGDRAFAVRFQPGQDGHLINAWAAWGKDVVGTDKHDPVTAGYRQKAKPGGHAWGYRVGAAKLAKTLGIPFLEARSFLNNLNRAFAGVVAWQDRITAYAEKHGFVVNGWGRKMPITGRAYTQAPALIGQSGTNEILADGLIRLPDRIIGMLKVTIHDAVILSMPKATIDRDLPFVVRCLSTSYKPEHGGQRIEFPFEHGTPGRTWADALHR